MDRRSQRAELFHNPLKRGPADRRAFVRASRAAGSMAHSARTAPLDQLRADLAEARATRRALDAAIDAADMRLARPPVGSAAIARPAESDWAWRADALRLPLGVAGLAPVPSRTEIGRGLTLFHDCPLSEITLRQQRNAGAGDTAPFSLIMDVMGFHGSFLSLALDLPDSLHDGLTRDQLLRLSAVVRLDRPMTVFARLNIKHGPNTEQQLYEMGAPGDAQQVEFDLAYVEFNPDRVERIWVDLILDHPAMTRVQIADLTVVRLPRAEI